MDFKVTAKGDHICLDKVLSKEKVVTLPSYIDGLPVTELGKYAFSDTAAQEVYLPPYLERIGAYAFYGCEDLKVIHACGKAGDLGAGVFAGDRMIALLDLCEFPGETSCLKEMLSEIHQTMRVRLRRISKDISGRCLADHTVYDDIPTDAGSEARLIFPEYYEESVENTPARQLVYEMHGCGQRYRYSFTNREFKFAEYDSLFPYAKNDAGEEIAAELAIGRLRFPVELTAGAREDYEAYLRQNWEAAAAILLDADEQKSVVTSNLEPETLPWLLEDIVKPDKEQLSAITDMAQKRGDTAMVSYCMDLAHKNAQKGEDAPRAGRRRFELT